MLTYSYLCQCFLDNKVCTNQFSISARPSASDIVYHEPNRQTKMGIEEAMSRKNYPAENLYTDVDEMIKALDAEV